ncbi:uncharacterized protein SPPG_04388 [Spizellomyces punctatus DAOM BR117]|uniref:RING-type E3 ubiquitin transferase n=1 Tax=Spizellomyces punctatus (strain DAOM BR117) TaxID=645134 RepID=A0A0L0HGW4_SPIPD|nr:uncharacterized protein SPPG_04388 [Spizellomyces punctatus DAOM BR117]KND00044.1 hypothetical protein SPPG_04388 [Spizellomyces punctatus DAOM BR117]|eukprot:XP_016608083.1 hypothetical protein SPPG_04388 [Spizellomyces punctatus DAOM BR117]
MRAAIVFVTALCASRAWGMPEASFFTAVVSSASSGNLDTYDIISAQPITGIQSPVFPLLFNTLAAPASWVGHVQDVADGCAFNTTTLLSLGNIRRVPLLELGTADCEPLDALQGISTLRPAGVLVYAASSDNQLKYPDTLEQSRFPIIQIERKVAQSIKTAILELASRNITGAGAVNTSMAIAYAAVTQAIPDATPSPRIPQGNVDVGLLWQFGLALIGGILFFGIPCTCVLSWWARRRIEASRALTLADVEANVLVADMSSHQSSSNLMKETDLKHFPIKRYRPHQFKRQQLSICDEKISVKESMKRESGAPQTPTTCPPDFLRTSTFPDSTITLSEEEPQPPTHQSIPEISDTASLRSTARSLAYCIDNCPICLDQFEEGEPIRELLPCQHYFHNECIEPWLTQRKSICPMCRINLLETCGSSPNIPGVDLGDGLTAPRVEERRALGQDQPVVHEELSVDNAATHPYRVPSYPHSDIGTRVPLYDLADGHPRDLSNS